MNTLQITLTCLGILFSAGTMLGTLLYANATKRLAEATTNQAQVSLEMARIARETSAREHEEYRQRCNQRYVFLAQKLHELWIKSTYIDHEIRKNNADSIDLSDIPEVAEFRIMFIRFMDEYGSEIASYLGVKSIEWEGLRYLEDMIRWVSDIPKMFLGMDDFYTRYQSVNQHILLTRQTLINKTQ